MRRLAIIAAPLFAALLTMSIALWVAAIDAEQQTQGTP